MEQQVDGLTMIRVYTGADGQFRWYEDDGKSQAYLSGKFAWTHITWDDNARQLTLRRDATAGTLELPPRKFVVQLFPKGETQIVDYDGRGAAVSF